MTTRLANRVRRALTLVALVLAGLAVFTASTHHVVESSEIAAASAVASPAHTMPDESMSASSAPPAVGTFTAEATGLVAAILGCVLLTLCSLMLLPRALRFARSMFASLCGRAPAVFRGLLSNAPRPSSPSLLLLSVSRT